MQIHFGQSVNPIRDNRTQAKRGSVLAVPKQCVQPSQDQIFFSGAHKNLLAPIPIDKRFIATEFTPEDEPRLLRIAREKPRGFIYSGLNDYEGMSFEENVHTYLHKEALAAQEQTPRRTYYLAIRDTHADNQVVGAIEVIGGEQEKDGEAQLATFIVPGYQNQGLLTHSLYAVLSKMLDLGIKPLWVETASYNRITQALMTKYDFTRIEDPDNESVIKAADGTASKLQGKRLVYRIDEETLRRHLAEFQEANSKDNGNPAAQ